MTPQAIVALCAAELEASAPAPEPAEPQYKPCTAYPLPVPAEVLAQVDSSESGRIHYGKFNSCGRTKWGTIKAQNDTHWCFVELPRIEAARPGPDAPVLSEEDDLAYRIWRESGAGLTDEWRTKPGRDMDYRTCWKHALNYARGKGARP